ncbi:protein translocase subunit SecF [bacterium]|jgi:preprotein translocase subunit SecF|nr:protein translocase subunit SecF [bacterium]MBT6832014.1 protein translocase subunit SecF [bacterium]MBT6996724.1 protein translocase subunit SecF [bacterium]MBT7772692.1 protein translocase subunit SecF [bacterium]
MKYNITAHRKIWLAISGSLVALSIALVGIFGTNLGLDFLGGIRWTVHFETPVETAQLTEFFATQDLEKNAQILSAAENDFLITLEELPEENLDTIKTNLTTTFGAYEEKSFRRVDSSIGAHFKQKAFTAVGVAMLGIILFVAFAFRKIPKSVNPWRFGGAAIVALFHDVLIILAIFTVLGVVLDVELDLQFITALLATLGFSVNDTIVILDRVRENLRLQKASDTFSDTIETSVQQTLQRSINTSISTLLPLLGLLFLGADAIFYFILALVIGISVGTYSSIFLAAPLLVTWKETMERRK